MFQAALLVLAVASQASAGVAYTDTYHYPAYQAAYAYAPAYTAYGSYAYAAPYTTYHAPAVSYGYAPVYAPFVKK